MPEPESIRNASAASPPTRDASPSFEAAGQRAVQRLVLRHWLALLSRWALPTAGTVLIVLVLLRLHLTLGQTVALASLTLVGYVGVTLALAWWRRPRHRTGAGGVGSGGRSARAVSFRLLV